MRHSTTSFPLLLVGPYGVDRACDKFGPGGFLMSDLDALFAQLSRSSFRSRFRLGPKESAYLDSRGRDAILAHAADFIALRLAPAEPANDGKQTPMRGHPVFIAQHATATCCRSCLAKWHNIPARRALGEREQSYVIAVIARWIDRSLIALPKMDGRDGTQTSAKD
jgi:hypothetical protein